MIRKGTFTDVQITRLQDSVDEEVSRLNDRLDVNPVFNGELHVLSNPTLPGHFTLRHTLRRIPRGVFVVDVALESLGLGANEVTAWRHAGDDLWTDKVARVTVSSPISPNATQIQLWLW